MREVKFEIIGSTGHKPEPKQMLSSGNSLGHQSGLDSQFLVEKHSQRVSSCLFYEKQPQLNSPSPPIRLYLMCTYQE